MPVGTVVSIYYIRRMYNIYKNPILERNHTQVIVFGNTFCEDNEYGTVVTSYGRKTIQV